MSTTFDSDSSNPFDASYEEYLRAIGTGNADPEEAVRGINGDDGTEMADDPEVTQASATISDFSSPGVGDGVEAPWSNLAEIIEGDPFANPRDGQD